MKAPSVGVLDYGMGNLRSVAKSLEAAGARVRVSDKRSDLAKSDLLVLPGQGAFGTAVEVLRRAKLADFVRGWLEEDKPYLGICLGYQLLFEGSEEAPGKKGFGFLRGRVRKFRKADAGGKIPHMGWNLAEPRRDREASRRLLDRPDYFYFVHSYYPDPQDEQAIWLETRYGKTFCSAVAVGRRVATQFHPEKSGAAGQRFLKAVLKGLDS